MVKSGAYSLFCCPKPATNTIQPINERAMNAGTTCIDDIAADNQNTLNIEHKTRWMKKITPIIYASK